MLRDRVKLVAHLGGCRLLLCLLLLAGGFPFPSFRPPTTHDSVALERTAPIRAELPVSSHVAAVPAEVCVLFNAASDLQLDTVLSETDFWSRATTTSSGIMPCGLVPSYLCDSARHQCSGVQLI